MPSTGGDPRAFDPQLRRGKDVAGAKRLVNKVPYPRPQRRRHGLEDHVPPDQTERGDRRNHEGEDDADRCPTGGPVSNTRLRGRPRFGEWSGLPCSGAPCLPPRCHRTEPTDRDLTGEASIGT